MYVRRMQPRKRLDETRGLVIMAGLAVTKPPDDERLPLVDPGIQSLST